MKNKTNNLTWNVYRYDINKRQIYQCNVFDHSRFRNEVLEIVNMNLSYDETSEKTRHAAMYYFWTKAEHEIVITSFPPYIDRKEFDRLASEDFKVLTNVRLKCGTKIDIYSQLMMNWDAFVKYVLDNIKRSSKEKQ